MPEIVNRIEIKIMGLDFFRERHILEGEPFCYSGTEFDECAFFSNLALRERRVVKQEGYITPLDGCICLPEEPDSLPSDSFFSIPGFSLRRTWAII